MKKYLVAAAAVMMVALVAPGHTQEQTPGATAAVPDTLRVQLVLARYQGDKKISSLPYTLTIHPDSRSRVGRANLRLGTQVPITTMARPSGEAANGPMAPMVPTVQYRDVGTNIDCFGTALDDGRYRLEVTVEDSSIETGAGGGSNTTNPAFKSFRTQDSLILRNGQSAQFSTATDKVNGDVWKVDVTLTVVK